MIKRDSESGPASFPTETTATPVMASAVLSDQVLAYLMRELVTGGIRQGDRVNEAELARRLGISRNPIREAVKRLEERGLLISVPRRGIYVRVFSKDDIDDVFSFRIAMECFAIEQALPKLTDRDIDGLANMVTGMETCAAEEDEAGLTELDMGFHRKLCELSGNRQTLHAFANIQHEIQMLIALVDFRFDSLHEAAADHWPVVEALRTRDLKASVSALTDHIQDAWSRIAREYDQSEA